MYISWKLALKYSILKLLYFIDIFYSDTRIFLNFYTCIGSFQSSNIFIHKEYMFDAIIDF